VAAGPVSRILSAGLLRRDGHSSGPRITARLKRPTRRFDAPSRHLSRWFRRSGVQLMGPTEPAGLPPYLVLLHVGFAMPASLLPRRCALTAPFHPYSADLVSRLVARGLARTAERYVFCGTFRPPGLNPASRTLSGTLLCGVRTFLPAHSRYLAVELSEIARMGGATVRSGCLRLNYNQNPVCL
jgi:hypothetical protein